MATQEEINQCVMQSHGNLEKVRALIDADPKLLGGKAEWDETPLQAASHMGREDIALFLLERGAELDFFTAAMLGRNELVRALAEEDASLPTSTGVHNLPSLYFPAVGGRESTVKLLALLGAPVNSGDGGNTPLHGAVMGGNERIVRWLLEQGANRSATNIEGKTPEQVAQDLSRHELASLVMVSKQTV